MPTTGHFLDKRISTMKTNENPARDLLIYYVGHGGFIGSESEYFLAIRRTRISNPRVSGIGIASLAYTLKEKARRLRRLVILDCCFASAAFHAFQSEPGQVAMRQAIDAFKGPGKDTVYPERGTALLCSSGPKVPSLISHDDKSTMFTEALFHALFTGDMRKEHKFCLSLRDISELIIEFLIDSPEKNAPRPYLHSPDQGDGDVAQIPFLPNLFYKPVIPFTSEHHDYGNGTVTLTHLLGKEFVPATKSGQIIHVLLEAKSSNLMAQVHMPLNFALVIDHSGSMRGAKLKNVREAIKKIIDRLEPTDYISVIIFSDTAQIIIPSMPAYDKPRLKAVIDRIQDASGRTMSLGMIQGLGELQRWNISNAINRMILLTDGVTYGDTDLCRQLAKDAAAKGISIYPLGIGSDWDEALLDDIGQLSGGMPAEFIRSPADAMAIFQQQLQSAVAVAVRNATMTLRLPVGVTPRKAVKILPLIYDIDQSSLSNRQVTIPLGDLEKDIAASVLIELMIDPRPAGLFRIGQIELSYDVPVAGVVGERVRDDITVTFINDANQTIYYNLQILNFIKKAKVNEELRMAFLSTDGITYPSNITYPSDNICPKCGFLNRPRAAYCKNDGQPLEAGLSRP